MTGNPMAPLGTTRRRPRLSDAETGRRMLDTALAMVHESGLTVSLEHISLEDVIREAGVSRSAVYRRWPYKDMFFSDLLRELASGAGPVIGADNLEAIDRVRRILLDRIDWLRTPELRRALAVEVLRQGALDEFETFHRSPEWRTYLALHATFLSLPDGDLRDEVQAALIGSEQNISARLAAAYERVITLLGCRLRPGTGVTYESMARLANASIRGLVIMAPSSPEIAAQRFTGNPAGAPEAAQWSHPALGLAALAIAFIEPDPAVEWTEDGTERFRSELTGDNWLKIVGAVEQP